MVPESRVTIPRRENKNIEFKEKLSAETHLKEEKRQHLAAQMKHRLEIGNGTVIYIVGVDDRGIAKGLTELEFEETLNVLKIVAQENNAIVDKIEKFPENGKLIGRIVIKSKGKEIKQHLIVASCGHVGHGKSTLIATLMTGRADDSHKAWLYLNVLPHEIERGLSADLHYALYGFKEGKVIHLKNPLDKKERAKIVENADKIISFIDTVGHSDFLRTAIRGLVGQNIDYALLVVAADDGIMQMTREHLGILLAMNLPIIVCLTKTDKIPKKKIEKIEEDVDALLKNVGRIPYKIKSEADIPVVVDKIETVVPLLQTSAVNLEGYDLLNKLLFSLPERKKEVDKPFLMFIDRVYNIAGVGTVVSGTVKQGKLHAGTELMLGPDSAGRFGRVKTKSIEMHYQRLAEANAGFIVGIALHGVKPKDIERGMVLCDCSMKPRAVKTFESEILVLNHPTRIASGYEPVYHGYTVAESAKLKLLDKKYLKSGESGTVQMTFCYKPQFINVGDKFVFREGKTKGIGTVTKIVKYV